MMWLRDIRWHWIVIGALIGAAFVSFSAGVRIGQAAAMMACSH